MDINEIKSLNTRYHENRLILPISKKNTFLVKLLPSTLQIIFSIMFLIIFSTLKNKFLKIKDIYNCVDINFSEKKNNFCFENFEIIFKQQIDDYNKYDIPKNNYYLNLNKEEKKIFIRNYFANETYMLTNNVEHGNIIFYDKLMSNIIFFEIVNILSKLIMFILCLVSFKFLVFEKKIFSLLDYFTYFNSFYIFYQYSNLFLNLFVEKKYFYNLINFSWGSFFTIFLIIMEKNLKINFLIYLTLFSINFLIGFKQNIEILNETVEFIFRTSIIISVNFLLYKKNKYFQKFVNDSKKDYNSLDDCFNNNKEAFLIIKKDGNFKYNKKFIKLIEKNHDGNFLLNLLNMYLDKQKNEMFINYRNLNNSPNKNALNYFLKDENFINSDIFKNFIKVNIFTEIDTYNQCLSDNLLELIENFNKEIFDIENSLKYKRRKSFNNSNNSNLDNERSNYGMIPKFPKNKLNESDNNIFNKSDNMMENKNSRKRIHQKNSFYNFDSNIINNGEIKSRKVNENPKMNNYSDSNNSLIKLCTQKAFNQDNICKNKIKLNDIVNSIKRNEDILKKINNCFDDFLTNLRFLFKNNNCYSFIYIGERPIREDLNLNDIEECDDMHDESCNYHKIKKSISLVSERNYNQNEKSKVDLQVLKQKIFIRFNKIDESLEVLFQNNEIITNNKSKEEKNKNSEFFEKIFSNTLMKICHEIKNPIINIFELIRVFKEKYFFKEEENIEIDMKRTYSYIKNIKQIAKSINFVIKDLEYLPEFLKFYEDKKEIVNKIKKNMKKTEEIVNIRKEINKITKIFEYKINSSKKEILIMTSMENLPERIKIENSLLFCCIYNILSNSVKFSSNGIIQINLDFDNNLKKLSIKIFDQGIGVKQENLHKLGNLFYKIDNKNNNYGLGLGLFKVKVITEAMNGLLLINSDYGNGTYISMEFPLIEDKPKSSNKIYKLLSNSCDSENIKLDKNFQKSNNGKSKNFYSVSNISSYLNNSKSNYCPSYKTTTKNTKKKKNSLSTINLNRKSDLFIDDRSKNSEKNLIRKSKTDFNFDRLKKNFIRTNTYEENKLCNLKEKYTYYPDSNFYSSKTNSIVINKSTIRKDSNYSSNQNKSTIRNSNIKDFVNILPEGAYNFKENLIDKLNNISTLNKNLDTNSKKINNNKIANNIYKNFLATKNTYLRSNNNINNQNSRIIYDCKSMKNFLDSNSVNANSDMFLANIKPGINQLNIPLNNSQIKGKIGKASIINNEYPNKRKLSTRIRNDLKLEINYNDVNIKFDTKSLVSSENIRSDESGKISENKCDINSNFNNRDIRFLVVDDEELIRSSHINIIKKYSKKEKCKIIVDEATDGADCLYKLYLGYLKGFKYDVILTDETMNFMNGSFTSNIIKTLIKEHILGNLVIIMITSYDPNLIENSTLGKHMDNIYSKPLNMNILDNIFCKYLN